MLTQTIPYSMRPLPPSSDRMSRPTSPPPPTQEWVECELQRDVPVNVRSGGRNLSLGFSADQEMYRALVSHTHAYEEWHVDLVWEQRRARAVDGLLNFDHHWCKATVLVREDDDRCPNCNRPI